MPVCPHCHRPLCVCVSSWLFSLFFLFLFCTAVTVYLVVVCSFCLCDRPVLLYFVSFGCSCFFLGSVVSVLSVFCLVRPTGLCLF